MRIIQYIGVSLVILSLVWVQPAAALSIGEERQIGEKLLYSVRQHFRLLDDPDISQYVNTLGQQVLAIAGPRFFRYHFFVVRSDEMNAFAAPGGLVFFYTGLIEKMHSENELLSVMAHEIGHVVSRHLAHRMDKGAKISAATMALGLASLALGIPQLSQGLLAGSLAAGQALNLHYSRQDEEQADRISFEFMQKMHRNPRAMVGMLRTMRRITRYRMGKLPQYLLTHPNPEARLDYVQSLVEIDPHQHEKGYYRTPDDFAFLRIFYRVLALSRDPEQVRTLAINARKKAHDRLHRLMADYGLALAEAREHNFSRALALLEGVHRQLGHQDILLVDRAVILLEQDRPRQSLDLLRQEQARNPADMYGKFVLARALRRSGDPHGAEAVLRQVVHHMPTYAQAYYELGKVMAATDRPAMSRLYLGKYSLYEGRIDMARHYLGQASEDSRLPASVRQEAADILARLRQLDKL